MSSAQKSRFSAGSLKQAQLSFPSTKRTASIQDSGKSAKLARSTSAPIRSDIESPRSSCSSSERDSIEADSLSFGEEDIDSADSNSITHTRKAGITVPRRSGRKRSAPSPEPTPSRQKTAKKKVGPPALSEIHQKPGIPKEYLRHYGEVRKKMGNIQPIHGENETPTHHILRIFDLSYEYGPCVGVTRLERWDRAYQLGLNPPPEVRDILLKKGDEFSQCVFYDEV